MARQQAERLARTLLTRATLPRGAQIRTGQPPKALDQAPDTAAGNPSVDLHELWTVGEPMNTVYSFLKKHAPAGMAWNGDGQAGDPAGPTEEFVGYGLKRLPAGVSQATLTMSVAPAGPDASVLRADVQVIWFPPRSAAEYVPAGMHAVTVTASFVNSRPRTVTRTFTTPAVVGRLAAMLNSAHASTGGDENCPAEVGSYRLAFARSPGATAYLVAVDTGCNTLQITVLNQQQPALQVPAGLGTTLASLMHSQSTTGTGVMIPAGPDAG
jgi:hypothetical protein